MRTLYSGVLRFEASTAAFCTVFEKNLLHICMFSASQSAVYPKIPEVHNSGVHVSIYNGDTVRSHRITEWG